MNQDESTAAGTTLEKSRLSPLNAFFPVVLTIIYAVTEATFVQDIRILRIHNALSGNASSATVFQLDLFVSFFLYLLSMKKWRRVQIGTISVNMPAMLVSLGLMSLLQCLMMERELAVAVFKTLHAIAP
jgi:hypothetical protein